MILDESKINTIEWYEEVNELNSIHFKFSIISS